MEKNSIVFRKIQKEEFLKLKKLFPDTEGMWIKYFNMRLKQFDDGEIDVYVALDNEDIIGEVTINYISHNLKSETIANIRVYLEAFRLESNYRGLGIGQKLIAYVIEDLTDKGFKEFTIGVEEDNTIAKHIYFKLGFTEAIDYGKGDEFDPSEYTLYLKR